MNKIKLVDTVAKQTGCSKKDVENIVNATLESITKALAQKDDVLFVGFGTFKVEKRAARKGRNPKTGEVIDIPAHRVIRFKPGKLLKEAIEE